MGDEQKQDAKISGHNLMALAFMALLGGGGGNALSNVLGGQPAFTPDQAVALEERIKAHVTQTLEYTGRETILQFAEHRARMHADARRPPHP